MKFQKMCPFEEGGRGSGNVCMHTIVTLPCWCLHLVVVGELEYPNDPESYAAGSVATGRVTPGGQVKG